MLLYILFSDFSFPLQGRRSVTRWLGAVGLLLLCYRATRNESCGRTVEHEPWQAKRRTLARQLPQITFFYGYGIGNDLLTVLDRSAEHEYPDKIFIFSNV